MRKLTSFIAALMISVATFAQAPKGFSYQAVVRDAQNAVVANQTVEVTLTLKAEIKSIPVQTYTEKHSVKTNANGLLTLVVGQGESSQKFSDFKWNLPEAVYNLETVTPYGTGTTQLLSVPYALYAEQAGDIDYAKLIQNLSESDLTTILGLADYLKKTDIQSQLAEYAKTDDVKAAYATKTEVAGKQNAITDLDTIRSGAILGSTALQEHQSLAAYVTTTKLNDTLAEYAKTAKLNDTLGHYVTIAELNDKNYIKAGDVNGEIDLDGYYSKNEVDALIQSLQTAMAQLTKNANQIGDMPLANVTVKVINKDNKATVKFLGKTLTSGETTFKVPAYSPVFLSVALSTFNVSNTYYTYTVKVNGQYFDNVAYEYKVANEKVYNTGEVASFSASTAFATNKLSDIKIGSKQKDDTYRNRSQYQDPQYIYVDVVDAIQDIDINNGRPKYQSGYSDMGYFENRLLIGVTNAQYNDSYGDEYLVQLYNGGDASPRIGVKPRWYSWTNKTWNAEDNYNTWEAAMGLLHMTDYNQGATFIKPIYAKVPNFIYKNTFTTKTMYKVGTAPGTSSVYNGLNANMNNQVVGPFNQTNNTIVIEVSSYDVVN